MDAMAYVFITAREKGKRIGLVKFGEDGYYQTDYDNVDSAAECRELVEALNARLGVPADVAASLFAGSMFGWSCPAAERARIYADALNG